MPFVVIEGLDGSGKSTQIRLMKDYLDKEKVRYRYLHFPRTSSPPFGTLISGFLRGEFGKISDVHPYLVSLLYAMDRYDAKASLEGWLRNAELILADRYVYSNIAFQCAKLDDSSEKERLAAWIKDLEYGYFHIPRPDLSIYLNVPFSFISNNLLSLREGTDRGYLEGKDDIHEQDLGFQRRVHEAYLWQVKSEKDFLKVDCAAVLTKMKSPREIFNSILALFRIHQII